MRLIYTAYQDYPFGIDLPPNRREEIQRARDFLAGLGNEGNRQSLGSGIIYDLAVKNVGPIKLTFSARLIDDITARDIPAADSIIIDLGYQGETPQGPIEWISIVTTKDIRELPNVYVDPTILSTFLQEGPNVLRDNFLNFLNSHPRREVDFRILALRLDDYLSQTTPEGPPYVGRAAELFKVNERVIFGDTNPANALELFKQSCRPDEPLLPPTAKR